MTDPTYNDDDWTVVLDCEPPEAVTEAELDLLADHLWDIIDAMLRDN